MKNSWLIQWKKKNGVFTCDMQENWLQEQFYFCSLASKRKEVKGVLRRENGIEMMWVSLGYFSGRKRMVLSPVPCIEICSENSFLAVFLLR